MECLRRWRRWRLGRGLRLLSDGGGLVGVEGTQPDRVLLLHGIAASSRSLRKLEQAITEAGYETLNLSYPSRKMSLEQLVHWLHAKRDWIAGRDHGWTHIVTYSMGGLLARAYIARYRPLSFGRMVMIAPPNGGSEIADLLARNPVYRWAFGPAGLQLTTEATELLSRTLGPVDYPLGIVAGDRAIDPLSWSLIPRPNDGRVSVARTKLREMTDHVTVHATHFAMMRNLEVIRQTLHFLCHGRFARAQGAASFT
jgi:pimeloyl-ACP methyl ester carboxylesterase